MTATSLFIVPALAPAANVVKAAFDPAICIATNAIAATVGCSSTTTCELDPTADLQPGTRYAACLSQDIAYTMGTGFEGFMATFTTAGGTTPVAVSAKLVRLDGTELNLTDKPIPRAVKVKYIPSVALTTAEEQQEFQAAVVLNDAAGTAVAGTYAWAADGTSLLFTPTARLKYRTTYTISVTGALPAAITIKAATTVGAFTTLTKHDINGDGFADVIVGANSDPTATATENSTSFTVPRRASRIATSARVRRVPRSLGTMPIISAMPRHSSAM